LILVSHDRYFISKTANKIWNIEDGEIKEFVGDYDEWTVFQQERQKRLQTAATVNTKTPIVEKKEKPAPVNNSDPAVVALRKEYQKQQKLFQKLEEDINRLQGEKAKLEAQLADPAFYTNKDQFVKIDEQYRQHTMKLEELTKNYDKAFEQILEMEEKLG